MPYEAFYQDIHGMSVNPAGIAGPSVAAGGPDPSGEQSVGCHGGRFGHSANLMDHVAGSAAVAVVIGKRTLVLSPPVSGRIHFGSAGAFQPQASELV